MNITPRDLRIEMLDDAGIVTFHLPGRETVGRRTLVFGRLRGTWSPTRRRSTRVDMRHKPATARE